MYASGVTYFTICIKRNALTDYVYFFFFQINHLGNIYAVEEQRTIFFHWSSI